MNTFSDLLNQHMQRAGLGDGALAWKLKLTRQAVYHWRKGHTKRPDCDKVGECADVLRLTPEERAELLSAAGCPYHEPVQESSNPDEQTTVLLDSLVDDSTAPVVPIVGIPITRPEQFFGRDRTLRRTLKKWRHLPLHSMAIVGPRRSGKTSLLNYVKMLGDTARCDNRTNEWREEFPFLQKYRFVFVDFQAAGMCEKSRLLPYLLEELELPVPDECDLPDFADTIRRNLQQPTIILMDEIDVALQCADLDYQFWWGIRALVSNQAAGKLGLLLASHQSPAEMIPEGGQDKPSPFLNIIGQIMHLSPFPDEEARMLLAKSPLPVPEHDIIWMLEQSGGWPSLLQILLDTWLTGQEEELPTEEWQEEGQDRIKPYRYLLETE
ncbi:MAG: helix-turn-helix transcriptional regulator [Pseudomonadota bacterium]